MTKAATAEARTSLRGIVETVFYSGPTFTAGRLRTPEGALVNFAGKVFAKSSDPVLFERQWMNHPKYGRQFSVEALGYDLEMDADGLTNFLANHPDVKGIGPAKARLIADEFGSGFDAAIRSRPEAVAAVAKAPIESILRSPFEPRMTERATSPRPVRGRHKMEPSIGDSVRPMAASHPV